MPLIPYGPSSPVQILYLKGKKSFYVLVEIIIFIIQVFTFDNVYKRRVQKLTTMYMSR